MNMNVKKLMLAAMLALPFLAQAHAHLEKSMPAADSSGKAPEQFMLEFNEAAQVTALTLQKQGAKEAQKLSPLPTKADKMVHVTAPKLEPGSYVLNWRAVTDDQHVTSGTVHFTVAP